MPCHAAGAAALAAGGEGGGRQSGDDVQHPGGADPHPEGPLEGDRRLRLRPQGLPGAGWALSDTAAVLSRQGRPDLTSRAFRLAASLQCAFSLRHSTPAEPSVVSLSVQAE